MIPRSHRVPKQLFEEIMNKGAVYHTPHFYLRAIPSPGEVRLAIVVPKKIERLATRRNALRRQGYVAIRHHSGSINDCAGIIFTKKDAGKLSPADRTAELLELLGHVSHVANRARA